MSLILRSRSRTPTNRPTSNPDTFRDVYHVTDDAIPGDPDPTDLDARLNVRTAEANRLGFVSLMDAALADTRRFPSSTSIADHMNHTIHHLSDTQFFSAVRQIQGWKSVEPGGESHQI
jgi:hypothetical protein